MTIVTLCVGSSCHIRGSEAIVEKLNQAIESYGLQDEVIPVAGFCFGKCNRYGATVQVDDDIFTGITKETFDAFFRENILPRAQAEG